MKSGKIHEKILFLSIIIYILAFFAICFWKYQTFQYKGMDLAIFNQVFYNTSFGRFFEFSIHPQSYLGDHFKPIIILLSSIYSIFRDPLTLLFLQTIFLGICAIPIFYLAKEKLSKNWALLISLGWLLNPYVQNVNTFEFHCVPLAIFFLLWTAYFYQKKKFWLFLLFIFLSMIVREDVALVVIMFGFVALVDQIISKKWDLKWIFAPILFGGAYFILALKIISFYSLGSNYKFLVFYSWLGRNFGEIIVNFFLHPIIVLKHILTIYNLEMILGFFVPFFFILFIRPKYLLLCFLVLIQIILTSMSGGAIVLKTHYICLFLPGLFLSFIESIRAFLDWNEKRLKQKDILDLKTLFFLALVVTFIYSAITLGPLFFIFDKIINKKIDNNFINAKKELLAKIPQNASVCGSFEFLSKLSSRQNLCSLNYVYMGVTQYAVNPYEMPKDTEYIIVDFRDFFSYQFLEEDSTLYREYYYSGDSRMLNYLKDYDLLDIFDTAALFKKKTSEENKDFALFNVSNSADLKKQEKIKEKMIKVLKEHAEKSEIFSKNEENILPVLLSINNLAPKNEIYHLKMEIADENKNIVYENYYPMAYGLYLSKNWKENENLYINYWVYLPNDIKKQLFEKKLDLNFYVVKLDGERTIDETGEVIEKIKSAEKINEIPVDVFEVF